MTHRAARERREGIPVPANVFHLTGDTGSNILLGRQVMASQSRNAQLRHWLLTALFTAVGYFVCARLGYAFSLRRGGVVIVWVPAGFMLALLLLMPRRDWFVAIVAGMLGNVVADTQNGSTLVTALLGAAANAFESLLAAAVLVKLLGRRVTLGTLREVGVFTLGAVVATNALSSVGGALLLWSQWHQHFWNAWLIWWTGDGMGMLVVTPVILTWSRFSRWRPYVRPWQIVEFAFVYAALIAVAHSLFTAQSGSGSLLGGHPYVAFPLLLWSAVRFGPRGAATGTFVLSCVVAWNAAHAGAPSVPVASTIQDVVEVYSYLALASLSSLVPASILAERARAERRLAESEHRFREMAEHIQEAFFHVDMATGQPIYVSPMWAKIWGRSMEDAYDRTIWFDAIHPEDRPTMMASQEAIRRGESSEAVFRAVRPDGSVRWVRSRAFPVRDATGQVYRVTGIAEDVTELHNAEERFTRVQKMEAVGRLAGGVAHDFNNLLTVIIGNAAELKRFVGASPDATELVEEIDKAADSATDLTRQLLAFSRQQLVEPTVFAVNDAIEETSKMLRRLIGEDVTLATKLSSKAGHVRIDRGQLEQLLTNLAVNARDAMPDGGTLTIATAAVTLDATFVQAHAGAGAGEFVRLEIADTGAGMTPEVLARAFEPFFTTKELGRGTGLGLATCYGIAKQAGGYIAVESKLGSGSTFQVYLPSVSGDEVAAEAAPKAALPRGSETILLVEDEPGVRKVAQRMLADLGYRVIAAADANEACECLFKSDAPIHLLLSDIVMPGMSGRELAEISTAMRPELRVLYVTGYTDDILLQHEVLAHDAVVVHKPLSAAALAVKVRQVLDRNLSE